MSPFKDLTPDLIEQTVNVNAIHPAYLSKALVSKQMARPQRSGMIIVSSGLGSLPASGTIPYSASKAFSSYLG